MNILHHISLLWLLWINLAWPSDHATFPINNQIMPDTTLCEGTLGDNILPDGDFGSGITNTLSEDPGLAPGYTYTTITPPNDGFYTISNNTSDWGDYANGDWIDIQDNSNDSLGYMMVINASTEPGIFYRDTVAVCANSTYEFAADIINIIEPLLGGRIFPNVDFLIDGNLLFQTGDIPQDAIWKKVGFTFTSGNEAFLILELRNNAPGGLGNDLALDNISFRPCGPQFSISVDRTGCEQESFTLTTQFVDIQFQNPNFQWQSSQDQGNTWTDIPNAQDSTLTIIGESGISYRVLSAEGQSNLALPHCRVNSDPLELDLTPSSFRTFDTICSNESVFFKGEIYNNAGTYEVIIPANPCDSIFILHLEVKPDKLFTQMINLCQDSSFIYEDSLISAPGLYEFHFFSNDGCDSLVLLDVQGLTNFETLISHTICGEPFYLFGEDTLHQSGLYTDTITSSGGCDSVINLDLSLSYWNYDLSSFIEIAEGDSAMIPLELEGTDFQIEWIPSASLSCSDCPNPIAYPSTNTLYTGYIYGEQGCSDTVQIEFRVNLNINFFIPTVFSPNGDGVNDHLVIYVNDNILQIDNLKIFDRWGNILYESFDQYLGNGQVAWNGDAKGAKVNPGVYVLQVKMRTIENDPIIHVQSVTVAY